MTIAAAAPSLVCEELPGVTIPPASNAGFSLPSAWSEVSARGPSSFLNTSLEWVGLPLKVVMGTSTGTISSSKFPAAWAFSAFWWLFRENSSACSRVTPYCFRRHSAVIPIPM